MKRLSKLSTTKLSQLILHIELPLILLQAVIFLVSYLVAREQSPAAAYLTYSPLVSHLLTPMMLAFFSALVVRRM